MNVEEKRFVLWGLKEKWSPSRIADALGVNEISVRRFRTDLVRNPNALIDLELFDQIQAQGVRAFQCAVCAVQLNSLDRVDQHVLTHFLEDADLDSAIAVRVRSRSQSALPMFWTSGMDGRSEGETHAEEDADKGGDEPLDEGRTETQAEEKGDTASIVSHDVDRSEVLEALRRLAALPDTLEHTHTPPSQPETGIADSPRQPETPASPPGDMDTHDVHSAFQRIAERRGAAANPPESLRTSESELEAESSSREAALGGVRDPDDEIPKSPNRSSPEGDETQAVDDRPRRWDVKKVTDHVARWIRTANAEWNRRDVIGGMGSVKESTSVTIESGAMKILSTRMLDVVDYRIIPLAPQLYAGGLVADAGTISRHLAAALADMNGAHRQVYAAIPGYQSAMRRLDLPDVREIDPNEVIPREARRALSIAVENSALRWRRLPGRSRIARWLVAAASDASYSAMSAVVRGAGHRMRALELRPFALTRAIAHPTVIGILVAPDGCDVTVVRNWEPHTYQPVYWETGSVADDADLARRLAEVVENTVDLHDLHNPEISLTPDVPVAVTGGEMEHRPELGIMVASNVGRNLIEAGNPLNAPIDFPYHSLVVNVGLALWDI